jgi:hypothetical protein
MALLDMKNNRPAPKDIGVITPYRKQVSHAWEGLRTVDTAIVMHCSSALLGCQRCLLLKSVRCTWVSSVVFARHEADVF